MRKQLKSSANSKLFLIAMKGLTPFYKRVLALTSSRELYIPSLAIEEKLFTKSFSMLNRCEAYAFIWDSLIYLYKNNLIKPLGHGKFVMQRINNP